jgi:hypothetical protein
MLIKQSSFDLGGICYQRVHRVAIFTSIAMEKMLPLVFTITSPIKMVCICSN